MDINQQIDSVTGTPRPQKSTTNAGWVREQSNTTAIENPDSATNKVLRVRGRTNLSVISKVTAVTIGGGAANDTLLVAIHIIAALTGTCVITGFFDSDNVAQSITLPAATAAKSIEFDYAINAAGPLTVTCSNAADDNLVCVEWAAV